MARTGLGIGNRLTFGKWGGEDIEWRLLDIKDGKVLLITEKAIDCQQYNKTQCDALWLKL